MSISAKELAQILQVSPATVSMVLNHKTGVSAATRDRVLAAAREYGYDLSRYAAQSDAARNVCYLIYKKSGQVVGDTQFFSGLTEGISNACKIHGLNLNIMYIYGSEPLNPQLQDLFEKEYQGVLLLATEMSREDLIPFSDFPYPLVVLDCCYEDLNFDTTLINNVQGSFVAASYLADCGFRKIGYLRSSYRIANFDERADGYFKVLRQRNIKKNQNYILDLSPSMEGAYSDMKNLLSRNIPLAQAYFADNDLIAAGAMRALTEAGVRIPEDVSVIGFDDIPLCNFLSPALSTMQVRTSDFGMLAVLLLVGKISHPVLCPIKTALSTRLVLRDSVRRRETQNP